MSGYRPFTFQGRVYDNTLAGVVMIGEMSLAETSISLRIPLGGSALPNLDAAYQWFLGAAQKEVIPTLSRTRKAFPPCVFAYVGHEWPELRIPTEKAPVKVRHGDDSNGYVAEVAGMPPGVGARVTIEFPVPANRLEDATGRPVFTVPDEDNPGFDPDFRPIVFHNGEFLLSLLHLWDNSTGLDDEIRARLAWHPIQIVLIRGDKIDAEFLSADLAQLPSRIGRLKKPTLDIRDKANSVALALQHSPLIQRHFTILEETLTANRMKEKAAVGQPVQPVSSVIDMVVKALPKKDLQWDKNETPARAAAAAVPVAEFLVTALDHGLQSLAEQQDSLFHHPKFMPFVGMLKKAMDRLNIPEEQRHQILVEIFSKDWTLNAELRSFLPPAIVPQALFQYGIKGTTLERLLAEQSSASQTATEPGEEEE